MRKSGLLFLASAVTALSLSASAEGFMPWSKVMAMADADGDGKLSPHEVMFFESSEHFVGFQPFMADHFRDFDADGDGFVTEAEARAGAERLGMSDTAVSKAFFERQGFMPRNAN